MHPYKMLIQKLTAEILILGGGEKGKKSYRGWLPVILIEQLLSTVLLAQFFVNFSSSSVILLLQK